MLINKYQKLKILFLIYIKCKKIKFLNQNNFLKKHVTLFLVQKEK